MIAILGVLLLASAAPSVPPVAADSTEVAAPSTGAATTDAFESRFEAFTARVDALRASDGDTVQLWEAEEIAAVAQEFWDEGDAAIARELLQEAMALLESSQTG